MRCSISMKKCGEVGACEQTHHIDTLSYAACRRNLPGDVCVIMRIHALLERWGLIDYQIDADLRPMMSGASSTSYLFSRRRMIETNRRFEKRSETRRQRRRQYVGSSNGSIQQETELGLISTNDNERDLPRIFSRRPGAKWRIGPIKKFFFPDGVEMYKNDWNKVCEHVGTRSQDECIIKFLQSPVEDSCLKGNTAAFGSLLLSKLTDTDTGIGTCTVKILWLVEYLEPTSVT